MAPVANYIADVATPTDGEPCDCHDANGDGWPDLLLMFRTEEVVAGLNLREVPGGESVPLTVTGNLTTAAGGHGFTGTDCVRLVPVRR